MSRLRLGRGGNRPAPARPAGGRPGVYVQTPRSDIFVVMLGIALGAILLGCLFLFIVWGRYGFAIKAAMAPSAAPVVLAAAEPSALPTYKTA